MLDLIAPAIGIAASAIVAANMKHRNAAVAAISGFTTGMGASFVVWFLIMAWVLRQ
jgi:hypothetical protein